MTLRLENTANVLHDCLVVTTKSMNKALETLLADISRQIEQLSNIEIRTQLKRTDYESCGCGSERKMMVLPEQSELKCDDCGRIKSIIGLVFRDDQFYPQEGQKTKHSGYDFTGITNFRWNVFRRSNIRHFHRKSLIRSNIA